MTEHRQEYSQLTGRTVKAAGNGKITVTAGLEQIGAKAAGDVKMMIKSVTTPPLKNATVAARARRHSKGKATGKPLVDSGLMLQSVTFAVEDK